MSLAPYQFGLWIFQLVSLLFPTCRASIVCFFTYFSPTAAPTASSNGYLCIPRERSCPGPWPTRGRCWRAQRGCSAGGRAAAGGRRAGGRRRVELRDMHIQKPPGRRGVYDVRRIGPRGGAPPPQFPRARPRGGSLWRRRRRGRIGRPGKRRGRCGRHFHRVD